MDSVLCCLFRQYHVRLPVVPLACILHVSALIANIYANDELDALVDFTLGNNPQVLAAQQQIERAMANRDELRGFFDPQLKASAQQNNDATLGYNQSLGQLGTEMAILPGAYVSARVQESYYDRLDYLDEITGETQEHLMQSLAGLRLNIPLWRDRGFKQWKLSDLQALKKYYAARHTLLAVSQGARHAVELQYISVLEAIAARQVARLATVRAQKLLRDAQELVKLNSLPEYQVFPAQGEVALRQEKEIAAQQNYETSVARLAELLGIPTAPYLSWSFSEALITWAETVDLPAVFPSVLALKYRGDYLLVLSEIEAAEAEKEINQDKLRSDFFLVMDGTLQGEAPDRVVGTDTYFSERNVGGLVGLTWQRPLGNRAEQARVRALEAVLAERRELLRQADIRIRTDLAVAQQSFGRARDRLRTVSVAVAADQKTLDSEAERFQLGEGRSRNVLDAQKDLTEAQLQQTVIAAELLRAHFNFLFATGYASELEE